MRELLALADEPGGALWDGLVLGYTEFALALVPVDLRGQPASSGHPLLRAEIASMYERVEPEQVLVFARAEA